MKIQLYLSTAVLAASGLLFAGPTGAMAQATPQQGGQMPNRQGMQQTENQRMQEQQQQEMQNQQNGQAAQSHQAKLADKKFVKDANEGNNAEIQLGKLALQKSQDDQVKQFAQRMVDDHSKLNEDMKPVAEQLGVQPTDSIPSSAQTTKNKLEALSGQQFDHAYIQAMVKDHKKDIRMVDKTIDKTKDQAVKEAAENAKQVMQQHLQEAEHLKQTLSAHAGSHGKQQG